MKKTTATLLLGFFCQYLSAQNVTLDPGCDKFLGAGSRIVCVENAGDHHFTVVVDSLGFLLEKTLDTHGTWVSTQPLPTPTMEAFTLQGQHIVGPATNIPLSADIVQRFEKLQSVALSDSGDYFIGASSTFESPGNATVDSVFVLKVSPTGTLLRAQLAEVITYGAQLFNTLAITHHGADFYYYKITSGGPISTNQFRIARVNEANDSLQLVDLFQGFGNLTIRKSPCGNNVFQVDVTGYYVIASLVFRNDAQLWHLDYDLPVPSAQLYREAYDVQLSNYPIPAQNAFQLALATADSGKITVRQDQPMRPFTPPDTFFVKKFDAANVLLWQKAVLLDYLPTNLLELPDQQVAILGIKNDAPVATLANCDSLFLSTGDQPSNSADFQVFPNPADGSVAIKMPPTSTAASGRIFNQLGFPEKSFSMSNGQATLDLSGLKNGVYFLQIATSTGRTGTKKLVVNRLE